MAIDLKDEILAGLRDLKEKTHEAFRGKLVIDERAQQYVTGYTDGINAAIQYLAALDEINLVLDLKVKSAND